MNQNALSGLEWLGFAYDVTNPIAGSVAVKHKRNLFQFADNEPEKTVEVYGAGYEVKNRFAVEVLEHNKLPADHVVEVNAAACKGRFEEAYQLNLDFFHLVQFGLLAAYRATLSGVEELRKQLDPTFAEDLNGTLAPEAVIRKWGTHFLHGGIFGGRLAYAQSISRFSVEDLEEAKMQVAANYQVFINGALHRGVKADPIETSEQSSSSFEVVGGDEKSLRGDWTEWAASVKKGLFGLVSLDSDSLVSIAELAENPVRREAIAAAIEAHLIPNRTPAAQQLRWNKEGLVTTIIGREVLPAAHIQLEQEDEVIVGVSIGGHESESAGTALAVKVLNLSSNKHYWKGSPNPENEVDISDLTRGATLVGLGIKAENSMTTRTVCYYQLLSPAKEKPRPAFLNQIIQPVYGGNPLDQYEVEFKPEPREGKVIVGISVGRDEQGGFSFLQLKRAPLWQVEVDQEYSRPAVAKLSMTI